MSDRFYSFSKASLTVLRQFQGIAYRLQQLEHKLCHLDFTPHYHLPIQPPIISGSEVAVVPEQGELATHGLAALLEALEHGQGGGAGAEAEVAGGNHAAFHRDQGALDQAQGALGHGVEHRVGVAGAAAETRTVGVAQGAVVVEAGLLPAVGGEGPLPAQKMHAATPVGLFNAFFLANALQALAFADDALGMGASVVAGMQANLMAALVDAAHQVADGGMLRLVLGVEAGVGAAADEVEGAVDTCRLAGIHQPVEGIERIARVQVAVRSGSNKNTIPSDSRCFSLKNIASYIAKELRPWSKCIGARSIHIVAHHHLELVLHQGQARPEAADYLAQDADPFIHDRPLQVAVLAGMGSRGRKALVIVEQLRRWIDLFATGQHPVGEARDVVVEMEASLGLRH